jgi:hypothetical protein
VEKVAATVHEIFEVIARECGVRGRWMCRRDDPSTYMEVYEGVGDEAKFEEVLYREGAKFGVPRVVEAFRNERPETPA